MRVVAGFTGKLTVPVGWLSLRVGGHLALSLHLSDKPGELSQWLYHDEGTMTRYRCIL